MIWDHKKRVVKLKIPNACKRLFVCILTLICIVTSTNAANLSNTENVHIRELKCETQIAAITPPLQLFAFGTVNVSISPNSNSAASKTLSLDAGESVRIDCSYSPASASVDFGLIAPDGRFYYKRVTNGSVDTKITVDECGNYTLLIRNNSSETVQVIGNIHY